jgi:hypothetical protein
MATLNLLSSPFASPARALPSANDHLSSLISPRFGSFQSSMSERALSPTECVAEMADEVRWHSDDAILRSSTGLVSISTPQKDSFTPQNDPFSIPSPSPSSLDSPGAYPALSPASAVPREVDEVRSPEVAPNRKRASSIMSRTEVTDSPPLLPESLPWVADAEDDTITSLYGLYHSSSSDHVWSPPSPVQNYSRPSSSASFYPPRPSSATVELLSPKSPPNDNQLTGSPQPEAPSRSSSALSIHTDLGPSSTTVPIGFHDQKRHGPQRTSTVLRRPQPLILSPPHPPAVELRQSLSSGSRPLEPLRLSMIQNSGQTLGSPLNETTPPDPSPPSSTHSDFSASNSRPLSSTRSSIIPEHILSASSTNSLSRLLLGTPGGQNQHHLSNSNPLTNITAPSPTLSQISTSISIVHRQYNPLIPHREFRNSVHLHSRCPSALSESIYAFQEKDEDTWNSRDERNSDVDPGETMRDPFPTSSSLYLGNPEEENAQPRSAFSDSPVSTTAPVLDQMIDEHAANPS